MTTNGPTNGAAKEKVWATMITNLAYLPGLLTLDYTLKKHKSKFPLVALYLDGFPKEGLVALEKRGIPAKRIPYLLPSTPKEFTNDPRFIDNWSRLAPFALTEYKRICMLDSDMMVLHNMDELLSDELLPLEPGTDRAFAASHACTCNPLKKAHYPKDWTPENCAFTSQHAKPDEAQDVGAPPSTGLGQLNGGLLVIVPDEAAYQVILQGLTSDRTSGYEFAEMDLLNDLFRDKWVALPYVYNALKTLRYDNVHAPIWRDDRVKNIHYILSPKPWDEKTKEERGRTDETHLWWWRDTEERYAQEERAGTRDEF